MPVPAALIMAIMSAASMAANAAGQRKVDKARAAAMRESRERNDEYARRGAASAQSTTDILTSTPKKEEAAAKERADAVIAARDQRNPVTGQTSDEIANSTRAPNESTALVQDRAIRKAQGDRFVNQQAQAAARLQGFGDVMTGNKIGVERNSQNLNQLANSMQNWNQDVLPMQLEAGNQAGNNWKTLADMIQVASMIYGGVGMMKGPPVSAATGADAVWNSPHLFEATKAAAPNFLPQAGAALPSAAYDSPELFNTVMTRGRNPYLLSGNTLFDPYR
jgi:hypothetical protein